jgi:hypothetical protein
MPIPVRFLSTVKMIAGFTALLFGFATVSASLGHAQGFSSSTSAAVAFAAPSADSFAAGGSTRGGVPPTAVGGIRPLSRLAFGSDISPLGVGLSATTNLNQHLNLRGNGSYFNYNGANFTTQGFTVTGKINLSSGRASVDYYPFHSGFRLSPGVMFHNGNQGTMNLAVTPGQSFTLNNQTYYSATGANAVKGIGTFGLGNGSPAFTMTTGWGNSIPRSGRRISFPFEIGAAFIHPPTLNFNLTGDGCDKSGAHCVDVATNPQIQQNIAIQVAKYRNDIAPLKTYPIASFGIAYNFSLRRSGPQFR